MIKKKYLAILKKKNIFPTQIIKETFLFIPIIIDENANVCRDDVVNTLISNGIECRPIVTGNFVKNPVIKYFNYSIHNSLTNSDLADKNGFFVGNQHFDITKEIEYLGKILREFLLK